MNVPDSSVSERTTTRLVSVPPTLLVSVRNVEEAAIAASLGVGIIDFKEPSDGPLAPVNASLWQKAVDRFPEHTLSAALGESDTARRIASLVPSRFRFAKVGPSGIRTTGKLAALWNDLHLENPIELVPVAYADHEAAHCVSPEQVLGLVIAQRRRRLLIDTFVKDGRGLLDHWGLDELSKLIVKARNASVWIAFAGSLRIEDVRRLREHNCFPDCIGVRGDVCVTPAFVGSTEPEVDRRPDINRRTGEISAGRIVRWMQNLEEASSR